VIDWAIRSARTVSDGVVLVVPADAASAEEPTVDRVVAGGATRSASVRAGLSAVPDSADHVLVHDAARPVPLIDLWERVVQALREGADAVVPVVPVTDTVRTRGGPTVDRAALVAVQTPQGFRADVLRAAHAAEPEGTDDASLAEAIGAVVTLVDGDSRNLKITEPWHLTIAEILVR
jgi:2-C-methyl-D-erythritol 4-phosphate cytidylyltransferase